MGVTTYADVTPLEPEWEIPGLVPRSFATLIIGDGGVGKGQLWADWAGRITTGRPLPNSEKDEDPELAGSVLLVSSEDDPNMTTVWRLMAAHANLARVHDMTEDFTIPEQLEALAAKVDEIGDVRMVVIDPLADNLGFIPGTRRQVSLTSGNTTLRRWLMRPLERLARNKGIAIVVIHHTRKDGRMAGSKAISDAARMVLHITRPDETQPLRLISVLKTNIASGADIVGYTITGTWPDIHVSYVEPPAEDDPPVREPTTEERVIELLVASSLPLTARHVSQVLKIDYGNVRTALTRAKERGLVESPKRSFWTVPGAVTAPLEVVK